MDRGFDTLDRQFHNIIHGVTNIPHISTIIDKLVESVETFFTLYRQETADKHTFFEEHEQIVNALKACDVDMAQEIMRSNIINNLEIVERIFTQYIAK